MFARPEVATGSTQMRDVLVALVVLAAGFFTLGQADAAESDSLKGHGHYAISYQYISVDGFEGSMGEIPIGTVDTHTLNFEIDYYLTDRLAVVLGLPFVRKRYQGPFQHNPLALVPPRVGVDNVDQGDWNNSFQDFHLGVRYLWRDTPVIIEPFAFLGVPSHDYPFFGHAAVGQNLLKFDVGSSFTWIPPISDAYYRLDIAYVFVEETLGVSIDHWRIHAEAGYQFGPRLTGRAFVLHKDGDGLVFPDDFPPPRTNEMWFQHDRLVKHNYTNVGVGLDWSMSEKYSVSTSVMTMTRAEQVHKMQYALTVGISRSF